MVRDPAGSQGLAAASSWGSGTCWASRRAMWSDSRRCSSRRSCSEPPCALGASSFLWPHHPLARMVGGRHPRGSDGGDGVAGVDDRRRQAAQDRDVGGIQRALAQLPAGVGHQRDPAGHAEQSQAWRAAGHEAGRAWVPHPRPIPPMAFWCIWPIISR